MQNIVRNQGIHKMFLTFFSSQVCLFPKFSNFDKCLEIGGESAEFRVLLVLLVRFFEMFCEDNWIN